MANQAIVVSITADSKGVDAELQKTKSKFQDLNKNIISDESTKSIGKIKSALRGLSGVTGEVGGVFGKIAGGLSAITSPIGLATAALTGFAALAVKYFKSFTMTSEQYARYMDTLRDKSKQNIEEQDEKQKTATSYFERLKQLNTLENLSNETRAETLAILRYLTQQYGDLGLSIDEATGKIIGLDAAVLKFNEDVNNAKVIEYGNTIDIGERKMRKKMKDHSKSGYLYQFATESEIDYAMNNGAEASDKLVAKAKKRKDMFYLKQLDQSTLSEDEKRKIEYTKKRKQELDSVKQAQGGKLTENQEEQYKYLQKKQKVYKNYLLLKQRQQVIDQLISKSTGDEQQHWMKIRQYTAQMVVDVTKQYHILEQSQYGQISRLERAKKLTQEIYKIRTKQKDLINKKANANLAEEAQKEDYQYKRAETREKFATNMRKAHLYEDVAADADFSAEYLDIRDMMQKSNLDKYTKYEQMKKKGDYTQSDVPFVQYYGAMQDRIQRYQYTLKQIQEAQNQMKTKGNTNIDIRKLDKSRQIQELNYMELKYNIEALTKRAKTQNLSVQNIELLGQMEKQKAFRDKQSATFRQIAAKYKKQATSINLKNQGMKDNLSDYFKDAKENLQAQIKMQEAVLDGQSQQIEKLKIINALRAKGYKISDIEAIDKEKLKQIDELAKKQAEFNKKTYLQQSTKAVDDQIKLLNLKLQGKLDELQIEKKILAAKQKGIQLTEEEAKKQVEKDKELNRLKFKQSFKDEAEDYLRANNPNRKQVEKERRIKGYEDKYGKLDEDQKRKVEQLVDYQFQLEAVKNENKVDLSKFDVKTNDLTAKGGFVGGAVSFGKDQVNTQLKQNSAKQISILQKIAQLITEIGMT